VSLFIDADLEQIDAAKESGAPVIEIHTGHYADATSIDQKNQELIKISKAVRHGNDIGLQVNAGHGLDYHNVKAIAAIDGIIELNIGHSIIARALFDGLAKAVSDMKALLIR
jgi:pyridoxine 5-phosphate synthase